MFFGGNTIMKYFKWRIIGAFLVLGVTLFNYFVDIVSIHLYIFILSAALGWELGYIPDTKSKKIMRLHSNITSSKVQLEQFSLVLNSLQEGVIYLDTNGNFLYANKTWEFITGFQLEEVIGQPITKFVAFEDQDKFANKIMQIKNNEDYHIMNVRFKSKNSENIIWVKFTIRHLMQGGFICTIADKTEQKRLEKNYLQTFVRLEQILLNYPAGFLFVDENNKLVIANRKLIDYVDNINSEINTKNCVGQNFKEILLQWTPHLFKNYKKVADNTIRIMNEKKPLYNRIINLPNGRVLSNDFLPIIQHDEYLGSLWSFRDITEEYYMNISLRRAKEEAKSANKAKSTFLSNMSHEFRTPLNAIIGFSQVLKIRQSHFSEEEQDYLNEIVKASHHLLELINDILNLSQIESGKVNLHLDKISVNDVINEALHLITPIVKKAKLEIHTDLITDENVYVHLDKVRLSQILINLLSNAVKYNKPNGSIIISSTLDKKQENVLIHIIDTGIGIKEEELGRIFDEFYRGNEHTQLIEGSGVGLTITKELVERMGGFIKVSSKKEKGTKFTVSFPIIKEYLQVSNLKIEKGHFFNEAVSQIQKEDIKILYVEGNKVNIDILKALLSETLNIEVDYASNSFDAMKKVVNNKYDLLLVNIHLSDKNGFDLYHFIRMGDSINKETPIIAVSGDVREEQIIKAKEMGFADYITKPVKLNSLVKSIHEVLINKKPI